MDKIIQPWALNKEDALKILESSTLGISDATVTERVALYGTNTFYAKEKTGTLSLFFKQFISPLIFLLIIASILTAILGEWLNTGVILFATFLNVFLGFYHEYHAENTLDKLTTYIKDRARVVRNGVEQEIDSEALVPGDVIKLSYGSRISADARILTSNNFRVDEAILTGESLPVAKIDTELPVSALVAEKKNIAFAGTLVVEGYATAVVYAIGNNTEIGKIAGIVSKIDRVKTPLQKGIDHIAWLIFALVLLLVLILFVLGISKGVPFLPMLVLSSAVAVGAVPESLPIALTVILALGAEQLAKKKGVIKKLSAAETLGSATLVMTDKTGTLTLADMKLVGIYDRGSILDSSQVSMDNVNKEQKEILELALLNTDISIENMNESKDKWIFHGRPFEVNIVKACRDAGISLDKFLNHISTMLLSFNSTNKFSVGAQNGTFAILGAPDILLKRSNISKEEYILFEEWIEKTSSEGKRIIGVARLPKKHHKENLLPDEVNDLEFLGILAFVDPIRPEVPQAIKNIQSHGVKIILITGDLVGTAKAVARDLGWIVKDDEVLSGSELRAMTDEELFVALPRIKIFARATPKDKLRIGLLYQRHGEVVAMTGDGVNDAPALKAMDIGISLGTGSDVAKSAADLVLLDDNFNTISLAIDEGRRILGNIRKTFVYLLSNSFDEVVVVGGSLIAGLVIPITALQIIWVNLFTGALPALSFAFDEDLDKEMYKGNNLKKVFTPEVKSLTFGIGILSSFFLFALYYFLNQLGIEEHVVRSIFFVCFSSYILFISFSFRSLHKFVFSYKTFSNKKLNISILISIAILILTMTVAPIREIFDIAPLPIEWLPFIFLWLILNVLLVEGTKYSIHKIHGVFRKFKY